MKKIRTHIKGLDELFLGGIQVTSVTNNNNAQDDKVDFDRDSLIIVIRGSRGVDKHLFAMQLMHGLGISIYNKFNRNDIAGTENSTQEKLLYYSINKPTHLLEDMYLDLLVDRWISHTNIEYKNLELKNDNDKLEGLNARTKLILDVLFDTTVLQGKYKNLLDSIKDEYANLLANNIIGYNARTNSIHVRSGNSNDDNSNCLFNRRCERIKDYISDVGFKGKYDKITDGYYKFKSEFLNVGFNCHITSEADNGKEKVNEKNLNSESSVTNINTPVRNAASARTNFYSVLNNIEAQLESNTSESSDKTSEYSHDVVVIDGFSHISEKDLQSLPYNHLLSCLRKLSRISILVFEDSQVSIPDGDVEIEIRSNYDESEDYTYNEIRIAKSVNQVTAIGWHLYKRQESHIRIYPSLHLRLFKRSYINNQMHTLGSSIFKDSYDSYIVEANKNASKKDNTNKDVNITSLLEKVVTYTELSKDDSDEFFNLLDSWDDELKSCDEEDILKYILSSRWRYERNNDGQESCNNNLRLHNHAPITTIVGNPNSFKRNIALCQAFSHISRNKNAHVLVVLLDKDPDEMRKKIVCPGLQECIKMEGKENCKNCYERISFLNVNSGCIPPEEFLSMLQDHIRVYIGDLNEKIQENRSLHIVLDDYHRIDFNFPFLSSSNLFTSALISLCQKYNVGLSVLCDKRSKRVSEVCTLSDYVLCIERNESDISKITIYTEKTGDYVKTSSIYKYEVSDPRHLMSCNKSKLQFCGNKIINVEEIGSMKEYWRRTTNIIDKSSHC